MKPFIVACLLVAAARADPGVVQAKWSAFKAQHDKTYEAHEEDLRLSNFLQATVEIEEHNARYHAGEVSYMLGHNAYSDLSASEFKSKMLGKKRMSMEGRNFTEVPAASMPSIPRSVDWRDKGIVTTPKNQESCGSCYSFGVLGVVESAIAQSTGRIVDLAEQQIVDCSYNYQGEMNSGCNGGHEVVVMDFVSQRGVVLENSYSYRSGQSNHHYSCQKSTGTYGRNLKYREVKPNDEQKLAEAIAQYGTLVMSISGENRDFQMYRGGIYDNPNCSKQVDHVISVVGYGSENGKDFWIVKNSWGTTWGENGFGRVRRGVNMCGVVSDSSWSISV
ncbi:mexicain [Galendromus occidentalis]|uniref:Mexicain n=1 Tax=Galendromus occidentalis TaxID=34638 RepID=A0AAJ6QTZ6_9ACAR|nr:mexicain [Galendromus occidentalis]